MKIGMLFIFSALMLACSSSGKNTDAGKIPAAMACPADQDPSQGCPSPLEPALPVQGSPGAVSPKVEAASRIKSQGRAIEGRCELRVVGEKTPRSCAEVKVMVRSLERGEMRDGVVDGFAVSFTDLHEDHYKFLAQSETYEVRTGGQTLKPGHRVVLVVNAKPRAR